MRYTPRLQLWASKGCVRHRCSRRLRSAQSCETPHKFPNPVSRTEGLRRKAGAFSFVVYGFSPPVSSFSCVWKLRSPMVWVTSAISAMERRQSRPCSPRGAPAARYAGLLGDNRAVSEQRRLFGRAGRSQSAAAGRLMGHSVGCLVCAKPLRIGGAAARAQCPRRRQAQVRMRW